MDFLKRIFGASNKSLSEPVETEEAMVPVPIPPLVTSLTHMEQKKGSPLTEAEVLQIRDEAVCMTMPVSVRDEVATKRGYADIDLENPWPEWQNVRTTLEQPSHD